MDSDDEAVQMHLLHEYNSTSRKRQLLHELLLESLRSNDIATFFSIVEQSLRKQPATLDLNSPLINSSGQTLLEVACRTGRVLFVEYLLKKGAELNKVNSAHNRAPIHFAAENGHENVLRVLLNEPTVNPNLEAGQQTALHIAVKKNSLNCAEVLLEKGASPNIPNSKGITALHAAVAKAQREMVELILRKSNHPIDLDKYKDYNRRTTRELLAKTFPDMDVSLASTQKPESNVYDLKYYLQANDEPNFLKCLEELEQEELNPEDVNFLIRIATQRNLENSVRALLKKIKGKGSYNLRTAIDSALQQGHPIILRELLTLRTDYDFGNQLVLNACRELGMPGSNGSGTTADREECVRIVLEREDADVRYSDGKGNTALHYAARAGSREVVKLLLEKGSYIGHMNKFGAPPVADIPASTLSEYFDHCLRARWERTNEYSIEFNYGCLMPHTPSYYADHEYNGNRIQGETDVLSYIASHSGLKHLLKHPLLSSFLYLKWRRIRHLLHLNFILYVLFYFLLNFYIIYAIYDTGKNQSGRNETISKSSNETVSRDTAFIPNIILKSLTGLTLICLVLRETLQLFSAPCHYIRKPQNWAEIILIIVAAAVLNGAGTAISAIAILLSAWELVMLMGQYPRMTTGIEMFKTVSFNFIRFLFLYVFLIIAFALAFFTLFQQAEEFPDPGHSLFKTIIMLTGEFEAKELPYGYHPVLSRFIFVLFVFLIAIVLFNLLNGLAVSDTAEILSKVELVGLVSRTQLIAYIENVVVRAPLARKPNGLSSCPAILHPPKCHPLAFLVHKVLLFPHYLQNGKLSVASESYLEAYSTKPNGLEYESAFSTDDKEKIVPTSKMDSQIIKQAKEVLARRCRESDAEKIIAELVAMKKRLAGIELTLRSVKAAVDNNNSNADDVVRD